MTLDKCPLCGASFSLELREQKLTLPFRGEEFELNEKSCYCMNCTNSFYTEDMLDYNLNQVYDQYYTKKSKETLTHITCLRTGVCQETEGFKGTEHEGLDMCEDGCVWYNPRAIV